jgi:hypothetical protein
MKQFAAGLPDFQTPNRNLGKFWKALEWKKLVHFMAIWNILRPFGIIYGCLLLSVVIWYIFPNLVCLDQEKSGNPDFQPFAAPFTKSAFSHLGGSCSVNFYVAKFYNVFFLAAVTQKQFSAHAQK